MLCVITLDSYYTKNIQIVFEMYVDVKYIHCWFSNPIEQPL